MARFFEKLEAQGGGRGIQFLSDHPNPGNRVKYVEEEVRGMPQRNYSRGSSNFADIRNRASRVPVSDTRRSYNHEAGSDHPHPALPSGQFREYRGQGFRVSYPDNWRPYGAENGQSVTIAPQEGLVQGSSGQVNIAVGAIAGYFSPDSDSLRSATNELVQDLRGKNPDMRQVRGQQQSVNVDGSEGEVLLLMGSSPLGSQREVNVLMTARRPQGLFYMVLVAPENDYNHYRPTFDQMQNSVRFR